MRGNSCYVVNSTMTSSCSTPESAGSERKSAFVPVPPTAASFNPSINLTADLLKRSDTANYTSNSYFNQLPPTMPPLTLHPYNRSHVLPATSAPSHSTHSNLDIPSSRIETFSNRLPSLNHNKVLVKTSDSSLIMSDVKGTKSSTGTTRSKRKLDVLSSSNRNIMKSGGESSQQAYKCDIAKPRRTKIDTAGSQSSANNNNTQIGRKPDKSVTWDRVKSESSDRGNSKSSNSSSAASKVLKHLLGCPNFT